MTDDYANNAYETFLYGQQVLGQPIAVEIQGEIPNGCREAIDQAVNFLETALEDNFIAVCSGVTVRIGDNLVEGGGEARAEENVILLGRRKMEMSLQKAEDLLVQMEMFEPGERTKTLPYDKDLPFSCLVYEFVHEMGHIADGKLPGPKYRHTNPELSPTKYGKQNEREAFAETFTYRVMGCPQTNAADKVIKATFGTRQSSHNNSLPR